MSNRDGDFIIFFRESVSELAFSKRQFPIYSAILDGDDKISFVEPPPPPPVSAFVL